MQIAGLGSLIGIIVFTLCLVLFAFRRILRSNKRQAATWNAYLAYQEAQKWRPDMYEVSMSKPIAPGQAWNTWRVSSPHRNMDHVRLQP